MVHQEMVKMLGGFAIWLTFSTALIFMCWRALSVKSKADMAALGVLWLIAQLAYFETWVVTRRWPDEKLSLASGWLVGMMAIACVLIYLFWRFTLAADRIHEEAQKQVVKSTPDPNSARAISG